MFLEEDLEVCMRTGGLVIELNLGMVSTSAGWAI